MAEPTVGEVMTPNPRSVSRDTPVVQAARLMRDHGIGDVVVLDAEGNPTGVLTDRDLAVRVIAEDRSPDETPVESVCSTDLTTVDPSTSASQAADTMREQALRRLPVVDGGSLVGVVSIGDLAVHLDPDSALADISATPPNQ